MFFFTVSFAQTIDTLNSNSVLNDSAFIMHKSPMGAFWRSAVLPGWGQFYNESYWKIPVIWGVSGWFVYMWIDRNNNYQKYKDLYLQGLAELSLENIGYKKLRDFYRDDRDLFALYIGITYFLNLIDAYVDAHLFDFDVSLNNFNHQSEFTFRFHL